jgi:hypothetical protein
MRSLDLVEEAKTCRMRALAYAGRPEAPFLLSVANAFEALALERNHASFLQGRSLPISGK